MSDPVLDVAALLATSQRVLFITGAGLSADSGLPTYRGVGGLYQDTNATETGVPIEEALSGAMLRRDPALCWRHIAQIEAACRGARANQGHAVIARLEQRLPHVCVLTQNVDGFHHAAGSRNVIAIHGDIRDLSCLDCAWRDRVEDYRGLALPPRCPACGGGVRPGAVLFGETLPADAVGRLQRELDRGFDLVFSVGTSSLFPYIVEPVVAAARAGVPTVEINPATTEISALVRFRLQQRAAAALRALERALEHR